MASEDHPDTPGYPLLLDLAERRCLVVGAGVVGTRKARGLLEAGAAVTVVAPRASAEIRELATSGRLSLAERPYLPGDLTGCTLVFAATDDPAVNRSVARHAAAAGIPVNVADSPAASTFTVPAVLRRGPITVAVSSGGASPALARRIRAEIEQTVGDEWAEVGALLRQTRSQIKQLLPDDRERSAAIDEALRGGLLDRVGRGAGPTADELLMEITERPAIGHVALVGAGPGSPDLLTVRGARLIARADVIAHDRLGTEAVLPLARAGCDLIDVGKAPGVHGMSQPDITALLIRLARSGRNVVRLKGGDPFVFGRGGEEAIALAEAGVDFELVPGVTSAIGGATAAGIPVTHRAVAQSVTIASGHDDPSSPAAAARWAALGAAPGTLVLLMAMTNLHAIAAALVEAGRSCDEPTCVIQWATTARERRIDGTLETIATECDAAGIGNPALVVIGPAVEVGRRLAREIDAGATRSARRHP